MATLTKACRKSRKYFIYTRCNFSFFPSPWKSSFKCTCIHTICCQFQPLLWKYWRAPNSKILSLGTFIYELQNTEGFWKLICAHFPPTSFMLFSKTLTERMNLSFVTSPRCDRSWVFLLIIQVCWWRNCRSWFYSGSWVLGFFFFNTASFSTIKEL